MRRALLGFHSNEHDVRVAFPAAVFIGELARLEAGVADQVHPLALSEEPADMLVKSNLADTATVAKKIAHKESITPIVGVGVKRPFEVAQAAITFVVPTVTGRGAEPIGAFVRDEEGHAARAAMHEGGLDRLAQVDRCDHVVNGIMDEDSVELTLEAERTHVAADMLTFRIQTPTDAQHSRREVRERHLEVLLEVR